MSNLSSENDNTVIHWFRRDLRLSDNRALYEATHSKASVVPVFVFDSEILRKLKDRKEKRVQFIFDGVMSLKENLQKKGKDLLVLHGNPVDLIPLVAEEVEASSVFCNEDYEPYAKKRDKKIRTLLAKKRIEFYSFKDQVIFSGREVLKKDGSPYRVYTPYKNSWLKNLCPSSLTNFKCDLTKLQGVEGIPDSKVTNIEDLGFSSAMTEPSGERAALRKYKSFERKLKEYSRSRDMIAEKGTSELSVYLRFGMISIRKLVRECRSTNSPGAKVWLSELIWRDFYQMILDQYPHVVKRPFLEKYEKLQWPGLGSHFTKWKQGRTGFPIVDAAMIHFAETGKMHNRLRMIVASFLVKDLLIDWKKGEKYFAQKLLDYDLAANNGGWQWCASTGCDAQPYFRVFNPISQSIKFDPRGEFIRQHLPMLRNYSDKEVHYPVSCSTLRQKEANCLIGRDYPFPIIDHNQQRYLAIKLFKQAGE